MQNSDGRLRLPQLLMQRKSRVDGAATTLWASEEAPLATATDIQLSRFSVAQARIPILRRAKIIMEQSA